MPLVYLDIKQNETTLIYNVLSPTLHILEVESMRVKIWNGASKSKYRMTLHEFEGVGCATRGKYRMDPPIM